MSLFGITNTGFMGGAPPSYVTNWAYRPQGQYYNQSTTVTTTATRLYYVPFRVWEQHTFSGVKTFNSGAGDTGETWRQGIYSHTTSGPGSLLVDFGQGTLTAASAGRTLSASVSLAPGVYWHAFHANTAAAWYAFTSSASAVGQFGYDMQAFVGTPSWADGVTSSSAECNHLYVDTAYGALASTAVAPTAQGASCPAFLLVA